MEEPSGLEITEPFRVAFFGGWKVVGFLFLLSVTTWVVFHDPNLWSTMVYNGQQWSIRGSINWIRLAINVLA